MYWFTLLVLGLVVLVVGLLAVPVVLTVDAERVEKVEATWQVAWLHGLVHARSPRRRSAGEADEVPEASAPRARPTKARTRGRRRGMAILRTRGLLPRVVRLARSLVRRVTFERLRLNIAFGLDNPADTGVCYGLLTPLLLMADRRGLDVQCRPVFVEPGLRGALHATVHVRPLAVLGTLLAFFLSPPVFRAARAAWRA